MSCQGIVRVVKTDDTGMSLHWRHGDMRTVKDAAKYLLKPNTLLYGDLTQITSAEQWKTLLEGGYSNLYCGKLEGKQVTCLVTGLLSLVRSRSSFPSNV